MTSSASPSTASSHPGSPSRSRSRLCSLCMAGLFLISVPAVQPVRNFNQRKMELEYHSHHNLSEHRHHPSKPFCVGDESLDPELPEPTSCRKRCTYELVAEDVCQLPNERSLSGELHPDYAVAAAFVDGNEDRRRPLRFLSKGNFHAPCRGSASPKDGVARTVLITLVPAFHGSTALLEFLMSNPGVSTLCDGDMWECEGSKLGALPKLFRHGSNYPCNPNNLPLTHPLVRGKSFALQCHLERWTALDSEGRIRNSSFPDMMDVVHDTRNIRYPKRFVNENQVNKTRAPASTHHAVDGGLRGANASELYIAKVQHELEKMFGDDFPHPGTVSLTAAIWDAVATWSNVWNLEKPVLLEKTPSWYDDVELLHDALTSYPGAWPLKAVRPVYTVMWKPLCLTTLSSHFLRAFYANGRGEETNTADVGSIYRTAKYSALQKEVDRIERAVAIMDWADRVGARLVVINYADLLWRSDVISARLQALLPCIASEGFDSQWVPAKKKDIWMFNQFKVEGSTESYGKKHTPKSMCYDLESGRCKPDFLSCGISTLGPALLSTQPYLDLLARYDTYVVRLLNTVDINF